MSGRRVRVAYLCHEYPKLTETFVIREIDRLRGMGMDVAVIAMKRPAPTDAIDGFEEKVRSAKYLAHDLGPRFLWAQLAAFFRSPIIFSTLLCKIVFAGAHRAGAGLKIRLGFFMRGALAALELRTMPGVRLLHCPFTGDEIFAAHTASLLTGIPLSFTLHAPLPLFRSSPLLAAQARHASFIAAISEDARSRIADLAGREILPRVKVVHCGVDVPEKVEIKPSVESAPRIVSVGSLSRYKGHDVLARAMGVLAEKGVNFTCDIVGDGPERKAVEDIIEKSGISGRVRMLGGLSQEKVARLLDEASLFVLASRVDEKGARDGIPVAIMEAMAHGKPCVSTAISGIGELVKDGETGYLVEPENPAALAAAVERLLENPGRAREMGEKGRDRVRKAFSLEEGAKLLKAEFGRIADSMVYISHEYPKVTETFVRREVEALRSAGMRIAVFSFRAPAGSKDDNTVYLPGPRSLFLYAKAMGYMMRRPVRSMSLLWKASISVGSPGTWRAGWGGVLDVIRGAYIAACSGPEVAGFHGSFASVAATAAWAGGKLSGIPFGFTSHSSPPDPLLAVKCRDARWIYSESLFDREYLKGFAGEGVKDKISIVKCGLDPKNWPEPDWKDERYEKGPALFVGTLGPKKGVVSLMKAAMKIAGEAADFRLDIVGDGPLGDKMRSMLKGTGAENNVRFLGEMEFDELSGVYYRSRFLVLPATVTAEGDRDGIPVTLMEAMASGMACVTTPVSGIPELVVNGETGIILPEEDTAALAEAMTALWKDPDKCRNMGRKGRERVFMEHDLDEQTRLFICGLKDRGVISNHAGNAADGRKNSGAI